MTENSVIEKIYNNNSLYFYTNGLSQEDLQKLLQEKFPEDNLVLNYVCNRNGQHLGFAYLWLSTENRDILLNMTVTPEIAKNTPPTEAPELKETTESNESKKLSWADLDELEEENKLLDDSPLSKIKFFRAFVNPPAAGISHHIICSRKAPNWVVESVIKQTFSKFNTGRHKYPLIKITRDRNIFVTFDPETNDALFAQQMSQKVMIDNGSPVILLFTPAFLRA